MSLIRHRKVHHLKRNSFSQEIGLHSKKIVLRKRDLLINSAGPDRENAGFSKDLHKKHGVKDYNILFLSIILRDCN